MGQMCFTFIFGLKCLHPGILFYQPSIYKPNCFFIWDCLVASLIQIMLLYLMCILCLYSLHSNSFPSTLCCKLICASFCCSLCCYSDVVLQGLHILFFILMDFLVSMNLQYSAKHILALPIASRLLLAAWQEGRPGCLCHLSLAGAAHERHPAGGFCLAQLCAGNVAIETPHKELSDVHYCNLHPSTWRLSRTCFCLCNPCIDEYSAPLL